MDGPPRCNTCPPGPSPGIVRARFRPGLSNDRGVQQQPAPVRGIPGGDRGSVLQKPMSLSRQLRSLLFRGCTADPIEDGDMHAPAGREAACS